MAIRRGAAGLLRTLTYLALGHASAANGRGMTGADVHQNSSFLGAGEQEGRWQPSEGRREVGYGEIARAEPGTE